ncbi:MAG: hypothetical protein ABJP34_06500 [Erythrobacter sp.]
MPVRPSLRERLRPYDVKIAADGTFWVVDVMTAFGSSKLEADVPQSAQ